jgi:CheY-like chemotaxis protein
METNESKSPPAAVLIVEDDPLLLELLEELVAGTGRRVYTAAHGDQAIQLLNEQSDIGAVVTDLVMPEMDGIRLIQWLNEKFPELAVFVLTATSAAGVGSLLGQHRIDAVFQKPLTGQRINQLLEALNSLHA